LPVTNLIFSSLHHKVTDFIQGGDLQQIWQDTGSFHEDLIKIYVAEVALVLGKKIFKSTLHLFEVERNFFGYLQISFTMPVSFTEI